MTGRGCFLPPAFFGKCLYTHTFWTRSIYNNPSRQRDCRKILKSTIPWSCVAFKLLVLNKAKTANILRTVSIRICNRTKSEAVIAYLRPGLMIEAENCPFLNKTLEMQVTFSESDLALRLWSICHRGELAKFDTKCSFGYILLLRKFNPA